MKILFSSTVIVVFMFITFFEGGLTSCTKDHTIYDTVTVEKRDTITLRDTVTVKDTVTDTLTIADTLVTEEILTANPWKLLEIRGVNEGDVLYYLRGGSSNTESFDNEYYVFNSDHTGYEITNIGARINLEWTLSDPDDPILTFTYHFNATTSMVVTWENLRFKNNSLYYDEYYFNPIVNKDFHGQAIRIAK